MCGFSYVLGVSRNMSEQSFSSQLSFSFEKKSGSFNVFLVQLCSNAYKCPDRLPCLGFVRSSEGYLNTGTMDSVEYGDS